MKHTGHHSVRDLGIFIASYIADNMENADVAWCIRNIDLSSPIKLLINKLPYFEYLTYKTSTR